MRFLLPPPSLGGILSAAMEFAFSPGEKTA
jgi:hypothetical protein